VAEAGNKPVDKQFPLGTGDTRTARELKTQMQGASDEFVNWAAKDVGPLHSRVAKMQGKLAKSELRRRGQGVAEEKAERAEKNDQPWVDPKLKRRMDYAFGHYAGYKDKPEAFFKWVMNSIDHSEQTDQQHEERFDRIEREIEQLSQRLNQVNEQHGSAVANRFSQRLAEHFAADRATADPTRSLFSESRAAKRAAIRRIFARQG
jgi:hypothetical protein